MASQITVLDPGAGGDEYQAFLPDDDPAAGLRQCIRITGDLQAQFAAILNAIPDAADYGLVVRVAGDRSTAASPASVAASVSAVTLLAANVAGRIGMSVYNNSNSALYIKTGSGASTSSFTVKVLPNGYWECPFKYVGIVTGVWDTAVGAALVAEYT